NAAENVKFPGGVETGLIKIGRADAAGAASTVGGRDVDGGPEASRRDGAAGAGLADSRFGLLQVEIGFDGSGDERVERWIVESFPPLAQLGGLSDGDAGAGCRLSGWLTRRAHPCF